RRRINMTFDDLPQEWQNRKESDVPSDFTSREDTISQICRKVERLNGVLDRRDLLEIGAAVFVIIAFSGMTLTMKEIVSRIGAGLVVISAIYIIFTLLRARAVAPRAAVDAPLRDFCRREVDRIQQQIALLKSVLWWYIGPIILGANLVFTGATGVGWFSAVYLLITILFGAWVYWLNERAVVKSLVPPRDELLGLLTELENDVS
ncbi:MAG: hypothetical protein KDA69_04380, partial [Planctomycetaceae bacterium]|nr:hypothetical protein [Planctomycetaceae bacterium]